MPGSVFGFPLRPTTGQGMVWTETLGGRHEPGTLSNTGASLSGFTDNRIAFGSATGGLEDSAALTFDGSTFAVTGAVTVSSTLAVTGTSTFSSQATFTGSGVTAAFRRTDNTSASQGNLVIERGTGAGTRAAIATTGDAANGVASLQFEVGGSIRLEVSSAGSLALAAASATHTISSTTASTTTGTGALIVAGGVGIAGAVNIGGVATITNTSGTPIQIVSANAFPELNIQSTATGAANNYVGHRMNLKNSAGTQTDFGYINCKATVVTASSEESQWTIGGRTAGTMQDWLRAKAGRWVFGLNPTDDGSNMLQVYGSAYVGGVATVSAGASTQSALIVNSSDTTGTFMRVQNAGTNRVLFGTGGTNVLTGSTTTDGVIRAETGGALYFATNGNNTRLTIASGGAVTIGGALSVGAITSTSVATVLGLVATATSGSNSFDMQPPETFATAQFHRFIFQPKYNAAASITAVAGLEFQRTSTTDGTYVGVVKLLARDTSGALTETVRARMPTAATHTGLMIYDVDNATLEQVTVGAADSGGAGFKVLRIPN